MYDLDYTKIDKEYLMLIGRIANLVRNAVEDALLKQERDHLMSDHQCVDDFGGGNSEALSF